MRQQERAEGTSVYLEADIKAKIADAAQHLGIGISAYIRGAVLERLRQEKKMES